MRCFKRSDNPFIVGIDGDTETIHTEKVYSFLYIFLRLLQMNKSTFPKIDENKDNKSVSGEKGRAAIVFTLKNEVGGLVKALKLFQVIIFRRCR